MLLYQIQVEFKVQVEFKEISYIQYSWIPLFENLQIGTKKLNCTCRHGSLTQPNFHTKVYSSSLFQMNSSGL